MKKTLTWITPKGAKIELTVDIKHVTETETCADGDVVKVGCDYWIRTVESCKLNGAETPMKQLDDFHNRLIVNRVGRQEIGAELPADVIEELFGEERRAEREALERRLNIAAKREAEIAKVERMMMTGRA